MFQSVGVEDVFSEGFEGNQAPVESMRVTRSMNAKVCDLESFAFDFVHVAWTTECVGVVAQS